MQKAQKQLHLFLCSNGLEVMPLIVISKRQIPRLVF